MRRELGRRLWLTEALVQRTAGASLYPARARGIAGALFLRPVLCPMSVRRRAVFELGVRERTWRWTAVAVGGRAAAGVGIS